MKGIILAGGKGSRLYPLTNIINKSLLPVYDKPMIYYPLSTLIENKINEIIIISSLEYISFYKELLKDGSQFGIKLHYLIQTEPKGIAEAFIIAADLIKNEKVCLILGDNIFYGDTTFKKAFKNFDSGATIFGYEVNDPERYGVVEFDESGQAISIEEKPPQPKSKYAIPGLYLYDEEVAEIAKSLKPSPRGELEITDINKNYLKRKKLKVQKMNRGCAWLDAGTCASLHESAAYVQAIEARQGIKIGCPEEAALDSGLLSLKNFKNSLNSMPESEYKNYLKKICI